MKPPYLRNNIGGKPKTGRIFVKKFFYAIFNKGYRVKTRLIMLLIKYLESNHLKIAFFIQDIKPLLAI